MINRTIFYALLLSLWFMPHMAAAKTKDGARFKTLFSILEGERGLSAIMDRSRWPNNDTLTSYLELELLYHPKYKASVKRLNSFIKRWPNHPQAGEIRNFLEIRITQNSRDQQALAWYDKNQAVSQVAKLRYLRLLLDAKRFKKARSIWRGLYVSGVTFPQSIQRRTTNFLKSMTVAEHEKRARYFLNHKKKKEMREVLKLLPDTTRKYLLALEAALNTELKFVYLLKNLSKQEARSPELWLVRINSLRRAGFRNKAYELLTGPEGQYLTKAMRQNQRFRLARLFALYKEYTTAINLLEPNIREMGGKLEDSLWLLAWYAHVSGNEKLAHKYFKMLGSEAGSPNRISQGAYWAAKTATSEKEREQWLKKAASYHESFYGLLAQEEVNGFISLLPKDKKLSCKSLSNPKYREEMKTLRMFGEAGRSYYLGPEIRQFAKKHGLDITEQLCLAQHFNAPNHVLKSARVLKNRGEKYWTGLFPIPTWQPTIGWQVDPSLIWGMARQESLFFYRAKSSADAHGLLQLLPATARQEAKDSGLPPSNSFRLKLPGYNLAVGQSYIKRMLQRFDGDLVLALTAYNAGPTRADRWWADRREQEPLTFIENIPIGETRHYVKRVIQGWMIYQLRLYGAASIQSALGPNQPGITSLLMADAR
ncbi:MAG: lytic transglycosylase domain-containing protein [Magnetococcales bacterium]|nr:lytic transglycosylase domain-containing protein [Magnetococcales bacterium]